MQSKEQIQKEIEAVRLQLNIADMSIITASEEEKERWEQKRSVLQQRLNELQKDLADNVVYDGDHAASIIDDATADAMLREILSIEETPRDPSTDTMADAMIDRILQTDETEIPRPVPQENIAPEPEKRTVADTMADAMIGNILGTDENASAPVIDDATADAMLSEILSAEDSTEPVAEVSPASQEDAAAEEMLQKILSAKEPEPDAQTSSPVFTEENEAPQPTAPVFTSYTPEEVPAQPVAPPVEPQASPILEDFSRRFAAVKESGAANAELLQQIEALKAAAEEADRRARAALTEAENIRKDAERIRLAAETERAMYAAEMELQRGMRDQAETVRQNADRAEKDRIAEKIARRKTEIAAIRNGLQDVKDSDSAFVVREKLFAVQLVLDEDERNSPEISYLLTKSLDDVAHALEVAELKRRIAALTVAAKKAAMRKPAPKKKAAAKKTTAKKKKVAAAARRRPTARPGARRRPPARPAPRYH